MPVKGLAEASLGESVLSGLLMTSVLFFIRRELFSGVPVTVYEHDGAHPLPSLSGYSSYPVTLPGLLKPRLLPLAGVLFCLMETEPEA